MLRCECLYADMVLCVCVLVCARKGMKVGVGMGMLGHGCSSVVQGIVRVGIRTRFGGGVRVGCGYGSKGVLRNSRETEMCRECLIVDVRVE